MGEVCRPCNTIASIARQLITVVLSEWPFISCGKLKVMPVFHSHFTFIITKSLGHYSITLNVFMVPSCAGQEMNLMINLLTLKKKVKGEGKVVRIIRNLRK